MKFTVKFVTEGVVFNRQLEQKNKVLRNTMDTLISLNPGQFLLEWCFVVCFKSVKLLFLVTIFIQL